MKKNRTYILTVFDAETQEVVTDIRTSEDLEKLWGDFEIDGVKEMVEILNNRLDELS